jgi:DnaJ-class molecular chaperone
MLSRIEDCRGCDGSGYIETWHGAYDPHNGEPITYSSKCNHCDGKGEVEIKDAYRTLADLDEEDALRVEQ